MAETKRYDVSGRDRGDGRKYPEGTLLKLTEKRAEAMGLTSRDVSKVTTTADDAIKRDRYEEAMTSQDRMREQERTAAAADADTKKRGARDKSAE